MWSCDKEENIIPTVCSRPEETLQFIDELGSEYFCTCADFGHYELTSIYTGDSVENAILKLGSSIKVIHAHKVTKNNDAHSIPYEFGTMNWDKIAMALKTIGYNGNFNFEVGESYYGKFNDDLIPEALKRLYETGCEIVNKII